MFCLFLLIIVDIIIIIKGDKLNLTIVYSLFSLLIVLITIICKLLINDPNYVRKYSFIISFVTISIVILIGLCIDDYGINLWLFEWYGFLGLILIELTLVISLIPIWLVTICFVDKFN